MNIKNNKKKKFQGVIFLDAVIALAVLMVFLCTVITLSAMAASRHRSSILQTKTAEVCQEQMLLVKELGFAGNDTGIRSYPLTDGAINMIVEIEVFRQQEDMKIARITVDAKDGRGVSHMAVSLELREK